MELRDYIMKFPPYWRGIFAPLSKNHQPLLCADSWLLGNREGALTCSSVGQMSAWHDNQVDWMGLVESMCEKEPAEISSQLVFLPRILLFPVNIQRNTFAFLCQHSAEIPIRCLEELLETMRNQSLSDEWIQHQLRTIQDSVCRKKCQNYGTGFWADDHRSKVTKASQDLFNDVCQRIRDVDRTCDKSEGYKPSFDWLPEALSTNQHTCHHMTCFTSDTETPDKTPLPIPEIMQLDSEENTMTNLASPVKIQQSDSCSYPEIIEIPDSPLSSPMEVEQAADEESHLKTSVELDVDKSVLSEDLHGGHSSPSDVEVRGKGGNTEDTGDRQERRDDIDAVTMDELSSLKATLYTSLGGPIPSEHLKGVINCPIDKMEAVCDVLELDSLPAAGLVTLVHHLAEFSLELSHSSAATLARRCFAKQVQSLTQTAHRNLITAIVGFAKAFPKPTIEGALIPALTTEGPVGVVSSHQCDLVAKVVTEALTNDSRVYLLSTILSVKTLQWSEELTGLHQTILGCKLELDNHTLEMFISALEHHGNSQNSCAKFAKLLLAVVNRFSKQVSPASLASLQRLADNNRTFLKKALLAAIKRVKGHSDHNADR